MRHRSTLGICAVLLAATGLTLPAASAAQETTQDTTQQTESSRPQDVAVRVHNYNWLDMHLYALQSGAPLRSLGIVTSQGSRVFHLPASAALAGADLRLVADPVGGSGVYVSDLVVTDTDSEVVLTLENALELSNTSVRPRRAGE